MGNIIFCASCNHAHSSGLDSDGERLPPRPCSRCECAKFVAPKK